MQYNSSVKKAYLHLHIAVFLFGFTAILGGLIQLQEVVMVWWRLVFTCFSLLFFSVVRKELVQLSWKTLARLSAIGLLVCAHWVFFYGSIKYANASTSLICLGTTAFFASLAEPIVMRHRLRWLDVCMGLLVIPGIALIAQDTPSNKLVGLWLGLGSAFLAAIFPVFNRKMVLKTNISSLTMTFVELGAGLIFITFLLPAYFYFFPNASFYPPREIDFLYLLILSLLCTTLAYSLAFNSLRHISAFASSLTVNLEPVYGIIMAMFILKEHEQVGIKFYLGVLIILAVVISHSLLSTFVKKHKAKKT